MAHFLKVICPRCSNKQIISSRAASTIMCKSCNALLGKASGGKTRMHARIKEVLI